MKTVLLAVALGCASAYGQVDPGTMAVQQAVQSAMQAGYLAGQQAQQSMLVSAEESQRDRKSVV